MSFVYPQFLFGLLAIGIPIIIHLFNFRRARKVYFSSNLFLRNIKKATSTKLKLKHYLILLSRILFIFFLVVTFAQPFIPAREKNIQSNLTIIYLDNSYSMSNYFESDLTAMEAAISYIQHIIDLYPQNSQFLFLTNDFAPFSNTPKSKNEIEELITELNYTGISRNIDEVFQRIRNNALNMNAGDIFWLSDFQKSTTDDLTGLTNDTTYNIFLIPMQFDNPVNVYVDSLYLSNPFLIQSEKNELNVILRNDGNDFIEDLLIRLFINQIQSANASLSIDPFGTAMVTFDLSTDLEKYNLGMISFEDFPVTFDNDFYFSLPLSDRISIIELKETDSATVVEKVYGNQSLFNFRSYLIGNIDYNDLMKADLIILNEIRYLDPTIFNVMSNFLSQNGDLVFIPSPESDLTSFGSLSGNLETIPDSLQNYQSLDQVDLENPFFSDIFEDDILNFSMPSARSIVNIRGSSEDIIQFRDGRNFLSYSLMEHKLYVIGSPLKPDYTDLHVHALFVPVMYRIAMLSKHEFNRLYFTLDESIIKLSVDSVFNESLLKLRHPEKEIIPESRIAGNELILDIPRFELDPGHYNLEIQDALVGTVAFNPDKRESRLDQYSLEYLRQMTSENSFIKLFNTEGFDKFDKEIRDKYLGTPLWRITLALTLIFLLLEIFLIRFL